MALDFILLTKEQIWGDDNGDRQLEVMKKYGTAVAPTDLAVLLGCYVTSRGDRTPEGDLTCYSWSASVNPESGGAYMLCIDCEGYKTGNEPNMRHISTRPVLRTSEASRINLHKTKGEILGCQVVEYGEYPQTIADEQTSSKMEKLFAADTLKKTGKSYTFDSAGLIDSSAFFEATSYPEYELDGKKYIRILGRPADYDSRLSTGKQAEVGKPYWVEVQPVEWLVDKTGMLVAKKCLFAGIQFNHSARYDGNFLQTFMKHYLDTYFAEEVELSEKDKKREATLEGLKAKLAEAIDPKKVEAKVGFTRTESRREIVKAIKTTRRARDVFVAAGKQAQKEGDQELIDQIVEMADFYVRSDQAQRRAARQRHAESRAQRVAKKDGGR